MLVLSRKLGECIHIGDGIQVTVVKIEGGRIRLGIDAPKSLPILRGELVWSDETHDETTATGLTVSKQTVATLDEPRRLADRNALRAERW